MPPITPTPSATPVQAPLLDAVTILRQKSQLVGLREAFQKAGMADSTANQVIQQSSDAQSYIDEFNTKVANIGTGPDLNWVTLIWTMTEGTQGKVEIHFPPNDPKYLPEFVRAQNHQLPVWATLSLTPGQATTIEHIFVGTKIQHGPGSHP